MERAEGQAPIATAEGVGDDDRDDRDQRRAARRTAWCDLAWAVNRTPDPSVTLAFERFARACGATGLIADDFTGRDPDAVRWPDEVR